MSTERTPWTGDRIAKLGFLMGSGADAAEIGAEVATNPRNVYRQAHRFGLRFRDVGKAVQIPPDVANILAAQAESRGYDLDDLIAKLLATCAAEPHLIWNVIDDDC